MMYNNKVVQALMHLKGYTPTALASAAGIRLQNLVEWLAEDSSSDTYVSRRNQGEVMRVLGVEGEGLRTDFVHRWKITETFGSRSSAFINLQGALFAFGKAYVVSFHQMNEKLFSFNRKQFFALRFENACVILEVDTPMLRSSYFDADKFEGLEWRRVEDIDNAHIVLLSPADYQRVLDGDLTTKEFDGLANDDGGSARWEKLHLMAREYDVTADDVEKWIKSRVKSAEQKNAIEMSGSLTTKKVVNGGVFTQDGSAPPPPQQPRRQDGPLKRATVADMSAYRNLTVADPVDA